MTILNDSYLVGQTGSSLNNGSVYIYKTNENEKLITDNIFPPNNIITGYMFGNSIDALGDFILIGAPHRTNNEGKSFLYMNINDQWELLQELIPSGVNVTSDFGSEVNEEIK